jgi:type VI protein secretion system component Hcp
MSFNSDGLLDIDEVLRIAELSINPEMGMDMFMVVESGGAPVEGESTRAFGDGKPHMDIQGYFMFALQVQQGSDKKYKASLAPLVVVRQSDAATASLYSLLNNGKLDVKATVQVYRAGGNAKSTQAEPVIEIIASDARIYCISSYTSTRLKQPCDIVVFAHRKLEIKTAPQQASGLRGAVRTCAMTS